MLKKKLKELTVLGNSLVYREKEVLNCFKAKLQHQKEISTHREKKALLQNSSDEDDDGLRFQHDNEAPI
jgi:hypothetical protein